MFEAKGVKEKEILEDFERFRKTRQSKLRKHKPDTHRF